MKLNERIYSLRTERKLSQGDLAELLDVSRQSVSKWETGAAVPELDKLIRMGEVFGVSLDELIKGSPAPSDMKTEVSPPSAPVYMGREPRITAALILLIFGGGVLFLLSLFGGLPAGLLCSLPFFACAAVCYAFRKRVGLWCAWAIYVLLQLYLSFTTGIGHSSWIGRLMMRIRYREEGAEHFDFNMYDIVSLVMFLAFVLLAVLTLRSFRELRIHPTRKAWVLTGAGIALYLGVHVTNGILGHVINERLAGNMAEDVLDSGLYLFYRIQSVLTYHVQYLGFTVLLVLIPAMIRGRQKS